jgi:hypothetical protein
MPPEELVRRNRESAKRKQKVPVNGRKLYAFKPLGKKECNVIRIPEMFELALTKKRSDWVLALQFQADRSDFLTLRRIRLSQQ